MKNNLIPMCRCHHTEQHAKGWVCMVERYPELESLLDRMGWRLETLFGRTRLNRSADGFNEDETEREDIDEDD